MTTKYEIPQYRNGVFFDEVRESASVGERKQVYLLKGKVIGLGEIKKYQDRDVEFFDGGVFASVRGEKTNEIKRLLKTKDFRELADGAEVAKTGIPILGSGKATIDITELLNMEGVFLAFDGVTPITDADRVEINIRMTQAAKFLEKDHKELSDWLRYVSRNAIALASHGKVSE